MIHGKKVDDLPALKTRAREAVMYFYCNMAGSDKVPDILRAMYVRKAEQAQLVLDGGSSLLISGEAEVRGWTPYQMATVVVHMAALGSDNLEIERSRINVALDNATTASEVMSVLAGIGCVLPNEGVNSVIPAPTGSLLDRPGSI